MYNRYIPESGQEPFAADAEVRGVDGGEGLSGIGQRLFRQLGILPEGFGSGMQNAGIAGILKGFGLEALDSGDILLMLILLLIFLEGDNTELVITLGLMLLLGGEENQTE